MKPGLDVVLAVLRHQPLPSGPNWPQALQAAETEHILPYFVTRVRLTQPNPTPELHALLTAAERESALQAFWWTSELKGLLQAFAAATLPVLPLKGPSLALRVYGGVALRPCRDLDLLVQPQDFPRASTLLQTLGFTPSSRPDDYHQPFVRGTTIVELHFDVENPLAFNFSTAAAWHRAQPGTFLGQPTLQLTPTDELLYLALHGTRHRFARLSYLLDFALAEQTVYPPQLRVPQVSTLRPGIESPPDLIPTLEFQGNAKSLAPLAVLAQLLTQKLDYPQTLTIPASPRTRAHMQALADRIWSTLLTDPERTIDWQELHRFYLDLQPNSLTRAFHAAAHLRILSTRLIDSDYTHAARFGLSHPALVWLLRQLRLLFR